MKKVFPVVLALLVPFALMSQNDGVVQFNIGEDASNANEISVIGGGNGMINIYRYNAYEHADRMPRPFHKDDSLHIWTYRCCGQSSGTWTLFDERFPNSTFTAMKDVWLTYEDFSSWWQDRKGVVANGEIYRTPSKKADVIPSDSITCTTFNVTEVNGDWLKVIYSPSGCAVTASGTVGWVMWRRKREVLVSFP